MRSIGLTTLKNKLSEYVRLAASGETVVVTDRDRVVAEIGPPNPRLELDFVGRTIVRCLPAGLDDATDIGRTRATGPQTGNDD
jgi:antitoxin (DNA-binding transcriptional repressor) of toxin-antitoxin stability system